MYVIYRDPADYPGVPFVVRRWDVIAGGVKPTGEVIQCGSLGYARLVAASATAGGVSFEREENDDPCIVETWI